MLIRIFTFLSSFITIIFALLWQWDEYLTNNVAMPYLFMPDIGVFILNISKYYFIIFLILSIACWCCEIYTRYANYLPPKE